MSFILGILEPADTCTNINISYQWWSACASDKVISKCRYLYGKMGRKTQFRATGFNNRILKSNGKQGNFLHIAVSRENIAGKVQFETLCLCRVFNRDRENHRGVLEQKY